jgi:AcrR family transcriptional regulator
VDERAKSGGRSGRPRDPAVAARALDAALDLYAERGWSGLTMDAVAERARIGKAALYLRWPSKEALLLEAISSAAPHIRTDTDLGAREMLVSLGTQMYAQYTGRYGPAAVRMAIEGPQLPELLAPLQAQYVAELRAGIDVLRRAIDRGELQLEVSAATVIEVLGGALLMRALFTSAMHEEGMEEDGEAFVEEVVSLLLDGRLAEAGAVARRQR